MGASHKEVRSCFVGAFIERPRATNGRPYEEPKHPYEKEPKQTGFLFRYSLQGMPVYYIRILLR